MFTGTTLLHPSDQGSDAIICQTKDLTAQESSRGKQTDRDQGMKHCTVKEGAVKLEDGGGGRGGMHAESWQCMKYHTDALMQMLTRSLHSKLYMIQDSGNLHEASGLSVC